MLGAKEPAVHLRGTALGNYAPIVRAYSTCGIRTEYDTAPAIVQRNLPRQTKPAELGSCACCSNTIRWYAKIQLNCFARIATRTVHGDGQAHV